MFNLKQLNIKKSKLTHKSERLHFEKTDVKYCHNIWRQISSNTVVELQLR